MTTREFEIPKTSNPWRIVEGEGKRWLVKRHDGVVWLCRLPDRAVWLLDEADAPPWSQVGGTPVADPDGHCEQLPMF